MKNLKKVLIFSIILTIFFLSGCANSLQSDDKLQNQFATLKVSSSDSKSRALDIDEIKFASCLISGSGINIGEAPSKSGFSVEGGVGTFTIENIPVGKNRIVTVQAFASSTEKIDGVTLRAVTDIVSGDNSVVVNWSTTALGNVFYNLLNSGYDISSVTQDQISQIQNAIPTDIHPSLVNVEKIAEDFKNSSLSAADGYKTEPATLKFIYDVPDNQNYYVQVTDPASQVKFCTGGQNLVENIAPGTWKVYVLSEDKQTVLVRKVLNIFTSGQTLNLGDIGPVQLTDIIVHAESKYKYMWYWETGADGQLAELKDEGNGWFGYTFENTDSMNLIFRFNSDNWEGQTANLSRNQPGEYWFKDGTWYDYNPDKPLTPVIKASVLPGTYLESQTVSLTGSNSSDIIYYTTDGTEPSSSSSVYSSPITVDGNMTIKAFGYNEGAEPQSGSVYEFSYKIDPNADIEAPKITASKSSGKYTESISVNFTIKDNKSNGVKVYYTTDSSSPTESSTSYLVISSGSTSGTGKDFSVNVKESLTVKILAVDAAGNKTLQSYSYRVTDSSVVDFREESIYFLMTTRFYDGDKSNNEYCWDEGGEYLAFGTDDCAWRGDFKGLADKLDYIKALGFSAIWITPVVENASGIDYHGYHAYDFSKVDPRYESVGFTYQDLIDACHKKGIKVIQDIVLNHSGNFGEKNIFHMFDKETTPYENKDIPLPSGSTVSKKRSPFMKLATDDSYGAKALAKALGGKDYDTSIGSVQYGARIDAMKEDSIDTEFIYHHAKMIDWNSENCQLGQMAGDCVDLNTENPKVAEYLRNCYINYINMGVDGFRIDTVKHISRLTFNKEFIPQFMEAGGDGFYIFGETCARYRGRWNEGVPALSPSFYTWKEDKTFSWSKTDHAANSKAASEHFATYKSGFDHPAWNGGIANHLLDGNKYHEPDYSMRSNLDQIDFPMHWAFSNASDAFRTAVQTNDPDFNDATWNVVYVDSHDYAPDNAPEGQRYAKPENWPQNMNLMFTFRGIPCIYYGSEIAFMSGAPIDPANTRTSLDKSGRAYFGDYIEGDVTATDFGEYTASGKVAETLNHDLAQHVIRLNKIRRAIPALQKGQYSTAGCSGNIAFKRRYTDNTVDSFVLVAIGGKADFTDVPSGDYLEVITGETVKSTGTLTTGEIDKDNMRIYVLKTPNCGVDGQIGTDGAYLK
ncbi:MAG: alpha-amylase family glycosyl hydrolase [Treponema sp.]|nr:alpha-amylase family glycosyl hydrolase [Treponema sp.]